MAELVCRVEGSSLSEGAERFESLIRGVKDRQLTEAHAAPEPKTVPNAFAVSPEEAWSKKFMTAGIGPHDFKPVQMPAIAVAAPSATLKPAPKDLEPAMKHAAPPAAPPAAPRPAAVRPEPIGQILAKPARRRSWFGRLVRSD